MCVILQQLKIFIFDIYSKYNATQPDVGVSYARLLHLKYLFALESNF